MRCSQGSRSGRTWMVSPILDMSASSALPAGPRLPLDVLPRAAAVPPVWWIGDSVSLHNKTPDNGYHP